LVGTTADFRRFGPRSPLPLNHLPGENPGTAGRIGEVRLISAHTNRILQGFRRDELITLDRRLALRNIEGLQAISGFTSDYLKVKSTPPEGLRFVDDLEHSRGGRANPQNV
jgi:hypothetical protein